jgi:hypothetical protein
VKWLALSALLVATTAHGQPVAQANGPIDTMRTQAQHLQDSVHILGDMAIGQDRETVVAILNTAALFLANFRPVSELATILPYMRDQQDAIRVSIQLVMDVDSALQSADSSLKTMNIALTLVHGPAVLAEATKARDSIIAIRDQLRTIKDTVPPSR